jgi:hypothetical protein
MPQRTDWKPFESLEGHVRLILLVDWDPLGVFGNPEAMDEYDSYVQTVASKLAAGASAADIRHLLDKFARDSMGLSRFNSEIAAAKLVDLQTYANDPSFWK